MVRQIPFGTNRLLDALSPADFASLAPNVKDLHFDQGVMLQEAGDPIEHIYFPCNGMISLLAVMCDGEGIETATVGREGAVGVMAGLGGRHSASRAVVQIAGDSSQIETAYFRAAVENSVSIRDLVVRYNDVQLSLVQQTAACNAVHQMESRLCRWILQTRDRCESYAIPLTQEFLAEMLGVQRTSVTAIAGRLQAAGLIKYRRGRIEVLDREGLEKRSCECYETGRVRTEGVFS